MLPCTSRVRKSLNLISIMTLMVNTRSYENITQYNGLRYPEEEF